MLLVLCFQMYQSMHVLWHYLKLYVFYPWIYRRATFPTLFYFSSQFCQYTPWGILAAIFCIVVAGDVS